MGAADLLCGESSSGLALLLFKASAGFVIKDPFFFILGIGIVIAFLVLFRYRHVPDLSSLCVIGAGSYWGSAPEWYTLPSALSLRHSW